AARKEDQGGRDQRGRLHSASASSSLRRPSYSALPRITAFAPAAYALRMSSSEETPPEYCSSSRVIFRTFARVSRSGPLIVPSRSMHVRMTPASGRSAQRPTSALSTTGSVSSHPPTAALLSRTSRAAMTRPGWANAHFSKRWGSRTAAVAITTASAPPSSSAFTPSSVRTPPATCISAFVCSSICAITARLLAEPRAASRSTTWMRVAPAAANRCAMVTGSSAYTVGCSYLPCVKRTQCPPRMSIAGITTIGQKTSLAIVGELQRDRDVLGFPERLDDELQRVLVFADDPQLVALDPHLELAGDVLDPLAEVARELVVDARVQPHLDLAASFADGLRVTRLEQLGRQLPPRALLPEHLKRGPGAVFARGLDDDDVVALVVSGRRVLEVEPRRDLAARLVDGVGQLRRVELGDDVEGVLSHC